MEYVRDFVPIPTPGKHAVLAAALSLVGATPALALDRSWNAGAGDWSGAANWSPVGVPLSTDAANIGNLAGVQNDAVMLDQNDSVAGLHITDGMQLWTDGFWLQVTGSTTVSGMNDTPEPGVFNSMLNIQPGAAGSYDFRTTDFTLSDYGHSRLWDGARLRVDGRLSIHDHSTLLGDGVISLYAGDTVALSNDGTINVLPGGLTIQQLGAGRIDLDGATGAGYVELLGVPIDGNYDSLTIIGTELTDSFSGQIAMSTGARLTMNLSNGWAVASAGRIDMVVSDAAVPARITGSELTLGGELRLWGSDGAGRIEADATIEPGAYVFASEADTLTFTGETTIAGGDFYTLLDGFIVFSGPTAVSGGSFETLGSELARGSIDFAGRTIWDGTVTMAGVARQLGDAVVDGPTTINAETFDFDGNGATWEINDGLTINAAAIDTAAATNRFDTSIDIPGTLFGRLTVNMDEPIYWQMNGSMTLAGPALGFSTRVAGSTMYMSGELNVASGQVQIDSDLILGGTTNVPAGTTLRLNGYSQIYGAAQIVGSGTLRNAGEGQINFYPGASLGQVAFMNTGRFHIGLLAGTASVARFEQSAAGTWSMNITGQSPDMENDLLIVSDGPATLAGTLYVHHYDLGDEPFRPEIGDEFTILTALNNVSGTFAADPVSFSQGLRFDWDVLYGSNDVKLRLEQIGTCALGDVDDDGDVDLQDLASLLSGFGLTSGATWSRGDLDGDGDVDLQDLANLLANFGSSCE